MELDFDTFGRIVEELFKGKPQVSKAKGIDGKEILSIRKVKCNGFRAGAIRFEIEGFGAENCFCGMCIDFENLIHREIELTEDDLLRMIHRMR